MRSDDVSTLPDTELRAMLLTLDGRGVANKTAALDELLKRATAAATPDPHKLLTGRVWCSEKLAQLFTVTSGEPLGLRFAGSRTVPVSDGKFVGYPATRLSDNTRALVALTKKPDGYPYDFVLI